MLTLTEIPDVSYCGYKLFLGTEDDNVSHRATKDAAEIFKDAFDGCILDHSKMTEHSEGED